MKKNYLLTFCILFLLGACNQRQKKQEELGASGQPAKHSLAALPDTTALRILSTYRVLATQDVLSQRWEIEDADREHSNMVFWDSVQNKRIFPGLYLYSDQTFTKNARCGISMGIWSLNKADRILILRPRDGKAEPYVIDKLGISNMKLSCILGKGMATLDLLADHLVQKKLLNDPFHPLNNQWRIRPLLQETQDQIRERVRACTSFYALFFKDNFQRRTKEVSYSGLPSCFTWFNGGIALKPPLALDTKWIACFYSERQAMEGYQMLEFVLNKHLLVWPKHAASWVEELASVLEQLGAQL